MTSQAQSSDPLTAKQRLAVSRHALLLVSKRSVWRGLSTWAVDESLHLLLRRASDVPEPDHKESSNSQ